MFRIGFSIAFCCRHWLIFQNSILPFLQGILVYMFRELMAYYVKAISASGYYSLAIQHTTTASYVVLCFWSESVMHRVCIGGAPRGLLLPRRILSLVASFLSLFEELPVCVSLIGFEDKLSECLGSCLSGTKAPSVVNTFGVKDFERCLATPTAQIIERNDFRTILDFLLMKLRTALDKDWLQSLPILHKVYHSPSLYSNCN